VLVIDDLHWQAPNGVRSRASTRVQ
jgi:hypothetical protein